MARHDDYYIPYAVCERCKIEMEVIRNGALLKVVNENKEPYYKILTDLWQCPKCKRKVYAGFAQQPLIVKGNKNFDKIPEFDTIKLNPRNKREVKKWNSIALDPKF